MPLSSRKKPHSRAKDSKAANKRSANVEALRLPAGAEVWVKRTRGKMSLEEKLGQLLMISFYGEFTSVENPEVQELVRQVEQNHVGGLMVATRRGSLGIERSQAYPT